MKYSQSVVIAVSAFFAGLAVSFFTLPLWVATAVTIAREGDRSDWFGLVGNLLGSIVTGTIAALAIAYAWRGISNQIAQARDELTINLISREEDRLERELPGLEESQKFLDALYERLSAANISPGREYLAALSEFGLDVPEAKLKAVLDRSLPLTDSRSKLAVERAIRALQLVARAMPEVRAEVERAPSLGPKAEAAARKFQAANEAMWHQIEFIRARRGDLIKKTATYRKRLVIYRARIQNALEDVG